jgi:hypothetical protein
VTLRAVSNSASGSGGTGSTVAQILAKCAIPFVLAPTGSMANNGAITLGTALSTTYANCYLYLPANAINGANAAGWYFAQMSSTTLGTVFQQTYAGPGLPTIPASPTAWVATGPGAYTGITTLTTGPQITLPANTLGANGFLRVTHLWSTIANADVKTATVGVGAATIYSSANSGSTANTVAQTGLLNRGVQNSQVGTPLASTGLSQSAGAMLFYTIALNAAQPVSFTMTLATATDFLTLEGFMIEAMP